MKLSEKGYLKIGNNIACWVEDGVIKVTFDPDKIEFKSDDFTGAVILTVEEAKAVQAIMEEVFFWLKDNFAFKNEVLTKRGMEDWKLFCDRIEQAEGK